MPPTSPEPVPYDWLPIALGAGALSLLLGGCMLCWCFTDLPKVLAPSLRKKEATNEIDGFLGGGGSDAPEDFDPELTLNPVLIDKLKKEKERNARKKANASGVGGFGPGALKKLGLQISAAISPRGDRPAGNKIAQLDNVDRMIAKDAPASGARTSATPPRGSSIKDCGKADKMRQQATERMYAGDKPTQQTLAGQQAARAAASAAGVPGRMSQPTTSLGMSGKRDSAQCTTVL